jgi:hypothetical protein
VVLNNIMKITIKIFLVITFIFFFSCEDQGLIVKCPDCTADEPAKTDLEVKTDLAPIGLETQINIYEGNIEDSILYASYKTSGIQTKIQVTLNKKYTVTATYYISDNYYIAIDSATPRVRYDKTQCDDPCYFVYDKVIDLRLKYTR